MAENVRQRKSRRDLVAYSHVSEKAVRYKALPERVEDSRDNQDSTSDWRSSKRSRDRFTRWPELECNKATIPKDDFKANQLSRRSWSPKWSDEEVHYEEGFTGSWEPKCGIRTVSKDGNVKRHTDRWATALDETGPDGWKKRDCITSLNGAWNRSCRSRSRSPSYRGKGGSDFWDERGRTGERSVGNCREFAAGRCRRGSQCRYLHEDSGRRHADKHYGSNITEIKESRSARDWYSESNSKEDIRDSCDEGAYSRDRLFQNHGGNSSGGKNHGLHRNHWSNGPCNDFSQGRCHRGSTCRYLHDDASSDGGFKDDKEMIRRSADKSFGQRFKPRRTSDVPCKYFAEGHCRHGEECRFFHQDVAYGHLETDNCSSRGSPKRGGKTATPWKGPNGGEKAASTSDWPQWDQKTAGTSAWPQWGEKTASTSDWPQWDQKTASTSAWPQGGEKTATSWDASKSGEKTASAWDGPNWGEKTTTACDGPKWGEKTITSRDGPKWGEKTTTSRSGPNWGDETSCKDVLNSSPWMCHSDGARDTATDSTDIGDCMHKSQHLPSQNPGDNTKILPQESLQPSQELSGLQDLVTVSTTMPESTQFPVPQHSGLKIEVLKDEQRDVSGTGIQIDLNLSANILSGENADPILNTSPSQQKRHLQPSHASNLPQSVQNELHAHTAPSNRQIEPPVVCSLPINAQSQTIVAKALSKTLTFSLDEQIEQIDPHERLNQQPPILSKQNQQKLPQSPHGGQNKQNSNFSRQHLQSVCDPQPRNNRENYWIASDGKNQETSSLTQSSPYSFSSDDQNQQSIAQLQSNSTSHVETGGEKSISDSELSEKHLSQLGSNCQTCQKVTTEKMKNADVSASFGQILENSPQLPQLQATYNSPTGTGVGTTKQNSNPSAVRPLSPAALPHVVPNQGSWSMQHCGTVSDNTKGAPSDASSPPASVVVVEAKDSTMKKSQANSDNLVSLSVTVRSNNGSGNLKKSANLEQKLHHGNQETERVVPSRSTMKEEKETDTDQGKMKQQISHSEKVEVHVHTDGENNRSKDEKDLRMFKFALVEFVKDILKPTWKEGRLSKEAHKTIVRKVVEKVTSTLQGSNIPQTQEKIDIYLSFSKTKLSKLVQAYVEKYRRAEPMFENS